MKISVNHQNKTVFIPVIVSVLVLLVMAQTGGTDTTVMGYICLVFAGYAVIDNIVPMSVTADDDSLTIKHLLFTNTITYTDIFDVDFSHYIQNVRRRLRVDHRVRLVIQTVGKNGSAGRTEINDRVKTDGMIIKGGNIPDEEIKLYQLYRYLKERTGK